MRIRETSAKIIRRFCGVRPVCVSLCTRAHEGARGAGRIGSSDGQGGKIPGGPASCADVRSKKNVVEGTARIEGEESN